MADHREPDVIILDVNMPKMDGITVLEKLRSDKRFAETPIIIRGAVGVQLCDGVQICYGRRKGIRARLPVTVPARACGKEIVID